MVERDKIVNKNFQRYNPAMELADFERTSRQIAEQYVRTKELALITHVEQIEGRVPTNEEVSKYGKMYLSCWDTTWEEFHWKNKPVFRIERIFSEGSFTVQVTPITSSIVKYPPPWENDYQI